MRELSEIPPLSLLPHPHLGDLIALRAKALGLTQAELGRQMCMHRQNIQQIYRKQWLNTELLHRFSQVLGLNFFETFCDEGTGIELHKGSGGGLLVSIRLPDDPVRRAELLQELQAALGRFHG